MPPIELRETSSPHIISDIATPALERYLQTGLIFVFDKFSSEFEKAQARPVSEVDSDNFPLNLSVNAPGSFAVAAATLNIQGGGSASVDLFRGDKKRDFLKALHLDASAGADLISFAFTAQLQSGPAGTVGDFSFGLTSGQEITVGNCAPVAASDVFSDATKRAISGLTLPHDLDDLRRLPAGHFCQVKGKGSLKFTASVQYSFYNNALASEPLEFISQSLSVKAHAGTKLQVAVERSDTHALTIASLGGNKVRLGVSLTEESNIEGSLDFSIGVSANAVNQDALAFLIEHVSPNPDKDLEKIKKALPNDARDLSDQIKKVLDGATKGGITASLHEALAKSREMNRLFVYEVDLDALDVDGVSAVEAALRGNFTAITANTLTGILEVDAISTLTLTTTHTLTIHLLGILNFSDVNSFVQKSKVALNSETGDVVLTSTDVRITENSIDSDHLREVLLRSAMITTPAASSPESPDFTFKMVFFLRKARAGTSDMQQFCNVLKSLSSPDVKAAEELAAQSATPVRDVGIYLSLDLNKQMSLAVLKDRDPDDFVIAGQDALRTVLAGIEGSANRLRLCSVGLGVWKQMREKGNRQDILAILQSCGITDQAAVVDFFGIDWWAQAMGKAATALAKKQPLKEAQKAALKDSQGGFDVPWALLATRLLAGSPAVEGKLITVPVSEVQTIGAGGR